MLRKIVVIGLSVIGLVFVSCNPSNNDVKTITKENTETVKAKLTDNEDIIYPNPRIKIDTIIIGKQRVDDINFSACEAKYPKISGFKNNDFESSINKKIKQIFDDLVLETKKESKEIADDYKLNGGYESYATYGVIDYFNFDIDYFSENLLIIRIRNTVIIGGGNAWVPNSKIFYIDLKNEELIEDFNKTLDFSVLSTTKVNLAIDNYIKGKYSDFDEKDFNIVYLTDSILAISQYSIIDNALIIYTEQYPLAHFSHNIFQVPILNLNSEGMKNEYKYLIK